MFILYCCFTAERKCNLKLLEETECYENELCNELNICECLPDYVRVNETYCEKKSTTNHSTANYSSLVDNHGSGSLVAGILIPTLLIAIIVCAVYATRRYQLMHWIRNKFRRNNENYDEFMIGQDDDDPPLA